MLQSPDYVAGFAVYITLAAMSPPKSLSAAVWLYVAFSLLLVGGFVVNHFSGQIVLTPGKLLSTGALLVACLGAAAWTRRAHRERGQATQALSIYCGFVCLGLGNLLGNLYLALLLGVPYCFVLHALRKPKGTDNYKEAER